MKDNENMGTQSFSFSVADNGADDVSVFAQIIKGVELWGEYKLSEAAIFDKGNPKDKWEPLPKGFSEDYLRYKLESKISPVIRLTGKYKDKAASILLSDGTMYLCVADADVEKTESIAGDILEQAFAEGGI